MSDLPASEASVPSKPQDPLAEMLEAAWIDVGKSITDDAERWRAAIESPIAKSSAPAKDAVARNVQEEVLALLVRSCMEFQIRSQFAQKNKSIHPQVLQAVLQSTIGFAAALSRGAKVTCGSVSCDWSGGADEAGPNGICPKCGSTCRASVEKQLVGADGKVL
jgi:hypothetical protein